MKITKSGLVVLFTGLVFSFSCQHPKEKAALVPVEIAENNIVDFDKAIVSIDFIPLKNLSEDPVNLNCDVWDLKVTDKYLIYSTICNPEAKIHFFDLEGNYLKTFAKNGDGPEEYQNIQGIDFDGNMINISVGGGMIKQYNLDNFEFVNAITLDGNASFISSLAKVSDTNWIYSTWYDGELDENGEYSVFRVAQTAKDSSSHLPIHATPLTAEIGEGSIAKMSQSFLLNFAFSNTLYRYENGIISVYELLDFGEGGLKSEDLQMGEEGFQVAVTDQSLVFNIGKIWHTNDVSRISTFGLAINPSMDLANTRTFPVHEVFINHDTKKVTSFLSLTGWSNGSGDAKEGYFYDVLSADDWINALEKGRFGNNEEKLQNLLDELEDHEDPIVIKYKVGVQD